MRRHIQKGGIKLKYLSQTGYFPSGNPRLYCKPPNSKAVAMPDTQKDDPAFLAAYVAATGAAPKPKPKSFGAGTIDAGITAYLGPSKFLGMASSTRERWRSRCDDFRLKYGAGMMEDLTARHVKIDLSDFEGHGRNNRLKVWRSLCKFWDKQGFIEVNFALQIAKDETPETGGFTAWTRQDFADFRAFWPVGSRERLAFELMYRTCARSVTHAAFRGPCCPMTVG